MIFSYHPLFDSHPFLARALPCKFAPLFSTTSTMLPAQPFSFQAFASLPGGGYAIFHFHFSIFPPPVFRTFFQVPYTLSSFFSHSSKNCRGVPQQFPIWNVNPGASDETEGTKRAGHAEQRSEWRTSSLRQISACGRRIILGRRELWLRAKSYFLCRNPRKADTKRARWDTRSSPKPILWMN